MSKRLLYQSFFIIRNVLGRWVCSAFTFTFASFLSIKYTIKSNLHDGSVCYFDLKNSFLYFKIYFIFSLFIAPHMVSHFPSGISFRHVEHKILQRGVDSPFPCV